MSNWSFMWDSEWKQRQDINALKTFGERRALRFGRQQRKLEERVAELEREVGELALVCRGLLTVLREAGAFDADALTAAMKEIDAEDGVIDGRVTPEDERPPAKKEPKPKPKAPRPRRRR